MVAVSVFDRWHKARPRPGERTCTHQEKGNRLVPSADHGKGRRWQVRYRDPDGEQRRPAFETKGEADAHRDAVAHKLRSGTYLRPEAKGVTLEAYGTQWLAGRRGDIATLDTYDRHLRLHVHPILGDRIISSLTPKDIREWTKCLMANSTHSESIYSTLSTLLTAAVDDKLLPSNPCKAESLAPLRPKNRQRAANNGPVKVWADPVTSAVIQALPQRYRAKGFLGAGAALRPAELIGFSPDDVDFEGGWVDVVRQVQWVKGSGLCYKLPKFGKVRRAPLSGGLADVLRLHAEAFPPVEVLLPWYDPHAKPGKEFRPRVVRLMFYTPQLKVVSSKVFNADHWKPALVDAGVIPDTPGPGDTKYMASPENGVRMLRHICATRWVESGESPVDVADWLGHENPLITFERYVHGRNGAGDRGSLATDAFVSATLRATTLSH
ncbi:site-specific integrase [Streptomyces sp. NPDC020807]|uniref:site-specific integrase n=1 Tax=Streptomyces sp. NPDC020807 TaxID=3155119 RepID=UPI0033C2C504